MRGYVKALCKVYFLLYVRIYIVMFVDYVPTYIIKCTSATSIKYMHILQTSCTDLLFSLLSVFHTVIKAYLLLELCCMFVWLMSYFTFTIDRVIRCQLWQSMWGFYHIVIVDSNTWKRILLKTVFNITHWNILQLWWLLWLWTRRTADLW